MGSPSWRHCSKGLANSCSTRIVPEGVSPRTWHKAVGADRLWAEGVDGKGITAAVVDTGVAKVADLAGRVIGGVDLSGGDEPYKDESGTTRSSPA